ncbi:hypothetical protein HMI54_011193 [Coelomomyces lativittatus]|nr:hypothetical protein HMI56_001793 [Coelomomyces lativittatus]KAJ1516011.1 hypothetical protein HMI54_011193 [Coelomomyces lativittatus]KAJ1516664.1 hypothetical protein HMI55_001714 [Coelomomyces lativittatus]
MRSTEVWTHFLASDPLSSSSSPIYAVCWSPDAMFVFVAMGTSIYVYDAMKGDLIHTLKAHRDPIYALHATDSKLFSGGADKTVVVWTFSSPNTYTATLRYTHDTSIQSIAANAISGSVCSTTSIDFGLWSQETKAVTKFKMNAKVTCCAWSKNGEYLALGTYHGTVSIRNKLGDELVLIERNHDHPIWSVQWNPSLPKAFQNTSFSSTSKEHFYLVITDWQPSYLIVHHSGRQVVRERVFPKSFGDPLCVSHWVQGKGYLVSGTGGYVGLWSSDGIFIGHVFERPGKWVWTCQASPQSSHFLVATQDGHLFMYQVILNTVHGLHLDRYVFRDGFSEVCIQDFGMTTACRLMCRDYVKKVAIFQEKVAIQLSSKVLIYELASSLNSVPSSASRSLEYTLYYKLPFKFQCNLMVVTSKHVLFCMDAVLDMYSMEGKLERQWKLDSFIRYIKVVGGPPGREMLFLGTRSGWTYKILIDHAFPFPLVKQASPIRCIDMNRRRTKLAVVDDTETCFVYDLVINPTSTSSFPSKETIASNNPCSRSLSSSTSATSIQDAHHPMLTPTSLFSENKLLETITTPSYVLLYQAPHANSVSWNTDHDDLLAFSGKHGISLKASTFPSVLQPLPGFVVGFSGPKLYCLHQYQMTVIDVPLSTCMYQYLEKHEIHHAYATAMLGGVSEKEWRTLGLEALKAQFYNISKLCFKKIHETRLLMTLDGLLHQMHPEKPSLGDIFAISQQFQAAEEAYIQLGQSEHAMQMYMDLTLYEDALRVAKAHALDTSGILKQKALFLADQQDFETAAETYFQVGDVAQAMSLLIQKGLVERVSKACEKYNKQLDSSTLQQVMHFFKQKKAWEPLITVYHSLKDYEALIKLYLQGEQYEKAFEIAKNHQLESLVYLPYAQHLALRDDFNGAQTYFMLAGRQDLAIQVLHQLCENALVEKRYLEASRLAWRLSKAYLVLLPGKMSDSSKFTSNELQHLDFHERFKYQANWIYAYHYVSKYIEEPFTSVPLLTLFQMARYLYTEFQWSPKKLAWPASLSRVLIQVALVQLGCKLGASTTASQLAVNLMNNHAVPLQYQSGLDRHGLLLKSKTHTLAPDDPSVAPICVGCSTPNAILSHRCIACNLPFVWSFHTFDVLPLLPFTVSESADPTAVASLDALVPSNSTSSTPTSSNRELDLFLLLASTATTPFLELHPKVFETLPPQRLLEVPSLHSCLPTLYYYIVLNTVPIILCRGCHRLFHTDDYEYLTVVNGNDCPLCHKLDSTLESH